MTKGDGENRPTERLKNMSETISSMAQTLPAVETAWAEKNASASRVQSKKEQGTDSFTTVSEVLKIADHAIKMALEKLDEWMISIASQEIIDRLENCHLDHNKVLVREAVRSALPDLIPSIWENDKGLSGVFE